MRYLTLIFTLFWSCGDSTLFEGSKARKNNVESIFFLNIGPNSATLVWNCEEEMDAYVTYGRETLDKIIPSLNFGKSHIVPKRTHSTNGLRLYRFLRKESRRYNLD